MAPEQVVYSGAKVWRCGDETLILNGMDLRAARSAFAAALASATGVARALVLKVVSVRIMNGNKVGTLTAC